MISFDRNDVRAAVIERLSIGGPKRDDPIPVRPTQHGFLY